MEINITNFNKMHLEGESNTMPIELLKVKFIF